ncbi:recombinase family protein [Sphingomonas glaciei]|uniref:Recombinase family protein n=1 Tax=Sphingomonas glaciei TaxID=2938948 RepID=A0ABY5MYH3_9SPHN|nr:recombinase family protein [Sphingomonas glaciei]UUR08148.1 recombinase family protein [Sphingomonas glaciei]
MSRVRCAIYTRKSSDEGLEQEFNSLDAQYDSCKAYIISQKHEGWTIARDRYDDGGFSGGSMERPGLKALLADIAAGKIDVVVIYKIDRLTRSLADFARIIEVMETHGASFVSVTQSFNTKTSMGRLMLHVLLSFAQFEREVGAERVRDKIAASKAKGMWMGGTVPLGYGAVDRKLVVNEAEAATVQALFTRFVELGSIHETLRWSQEQGLTTKVRQRSGAQIGGTPFHYGALRCVLSNRTYVGEVEHKGKAYPGQHAAIVDRDLFDRAAAILASRSTEEMRRPKLATASLLQGLIFDRHGRKMGPVHTTREGQRFRYYVTNAKRIEAGGPIAYRIAAVTIERNCLIIVAEHLAAQVRSIDDGAATAASTPNGGGQRQLICDHVRRVVIGDAELSIELKDGAILRRSLERVRHGNDAKLIVGSPPAEDKPVASSQLVLLLTDAARARELALAKPKLSLDALAAKFGRSPERFKRLIRLGYLSPKIVTAILRGEQPAHLTSRALQHLDGLPLAWSEQEAMLLS